MVYDPQKLRNKRTDVVLQEAMLTLLGKRSYESINIVDICREAMVHRTTFYNHFEDKEHLLGDCVKGIKEQLESEVHGKVLAVSPSAYYAQLLQSLVAYLDKNPERIEGLVNRESNQIFWSKLQELIAYDVKVRMSTYADQGYVYVVDLQINAQFFCTGIIGTLLWWLRRGRPVEAAEFFEQMTMLMDPRNDRHSF